MFFGNPDLLERNLHADLNTLIKNVKARQDQYLTLLQYNKNLISNIHQIDQMSYFSEQIKKHRSYLASSRSVNQRIIVEQQQIKQKYECVSSSQPSVVKLLGRVIARVLEICQSSVQKGKYLDSCLSEQFTAFKAKLLETLNENGKISINTLLETIIYYSVNKDNKQIGRLQEIIKIFIDGDLSKLNQIYQPPKLQLQNVAIHEAKRVSQIMDKPMEKKEMATNHSPEKSRSMSPEKNYIQQMKQQQKVKKKKAKAVKDIVNYMSSVMDISKQHINEDYGYSIHPEQKKKRLYDEIFSRNKFNYDQIISFEKKKEEFETKVKQFKILMEQESKRIEQALKNKLTEKKFSQHRIGIEKKHSITVFVSQTCEHDQEEKIGLEKADRSFRRRQRKQILMHQSPKVSKQKIFSSMQSTQDNFQHIKFDIKNQEVFTRSNRARLPQIPGRSSLDYRYEQKNQSQLSGKKQQKRINIMKNVEIGKMNIPSAIKNSLNQSINNNSNSNKKSQRDRSGQTLFDNVTNINLPNNGLNGLDYTFYVRKKVNKFYESKNKFVS